MYRLGTDGGSRNNPTHMDLDVCSPTAARWRMTVLFSCRQIHRETLGGFLIRFLSLKGVPESYEAFSATMVFPPQIPHPVVTSSHSLLA